MTAALGVSRLGDATAAVARRLGGRAAAISLAVLAMLAGAATYAWLAGFVVPVAPGGLGIREAAILAMCGSGIPAAGLVVAVIVLRLASVLGDMGFGLFAYSRR